jgi:hypothetical protein
LLQAAGGPGAAHTAFVSSGNIGSFGSPDWLDGAASITAESRVAAAAILRKYRVPYRRQSRLHDNLQLYLVSGSVVLGRNEEAELHVKGRLAL